MDSSDTGIGGLKEAIISIAGKGAFRMLKYESGVHRVQRVPKTETRVGFILLLQRLLSCQKLRM